MNRCNYSLEFLGDVLDVGFISANFTKLLVQLICIKFSNIILTIEN